MTLELLVVLINLLSAKIIKFAPITHVIINNTFIIIIVTNLTADMKNISILEVTLRQSLKTSLM